MKKIIRLTESDLARIVRRVINEQAQNMPFCDQYKDKPEKYKNCLCPEQIEYKDVEPSLYRQSTVKKSSSNNFYFRTIGNDSVEFRQEWVVFDNNQIFKMDSNRTLFKNENLKPTFNFIETHFKINYPGYKNLFISGAQWDDYKDLSQKFPEIFRKVGSYGDSPYGYSVNLASVPNVKIPSDVITNYFVGKTWVYEVNNGSINTLFAKGTPPNIHPDFIKKFNSRIRT